MLSGAMACNMPGWEYNPHDVDGRGKQFSTVSSAAECAAICRSRECCASFEYNQHAKKCGTYTSGLVALSGYLQAENEGWITCVSTMPDTLSKAGCLFNGLPSVEGMLASNKQLETLRRHFREAQHGNTLSIAVVGSSGNMLDRGYGPDIDSKDVVFRINDAPTHAEQTPDVGKGYPDRTRGLVRSGWGAGLRHAVRHHRNHPSPASDG